VNIKKYFSKYKCIIITIICTTGLTGSSYAIEKKSLFTEFENASLKSKTTIDFINKSLLIGFDDNGYLAKKLNAKITNQTYSIPAKYSEKEIITHHSNALKESGFIMLANCTGFACGSIASMSEALNTPVLFGYDKSQHYRLYNLNDKLYVSIYTLGYEKEKLLNIQIIEPENTINSNLSLDSDYLSKFLTKQGKVTLPNLHFNFDSEILKPSSNQTIVDLATYLKAAADDKFYIVGHTDDKGTADYNSELSIKRAQTVASALTKLGVDKTQVTAIGVGEYAPLFNNDNEINRERNRRVELVKRTDSL